MLDLTATPASKGLPEATTEAQTPIQWPNEQNDDVFDFQDAFDFGSGRLTTRTLLDFSEWDEDSPVSGSYDVSVDEEAASWQSELLLETEDDGGPEMTLKSLVEFRSDAAGKAFEPALFAEPARRRAGGGLKPFLPASGHQLIADESYASRFG